MKVNAVFLPDSRIQRNSNSHRPLGSSRLFLIAEEFMNRAQCEEIRKAIALVLYWFGKQDFRLCSLIQIYRISLYKTWKSCSESMAFKPIQLGSLYRYGRQHFVAASDLEVRKSCDTQKKEKKAFFVI